MFSLFFFEFILHLRRATSFAIMNKSGLSLSEMIKLSGFLHWLFFIYLFFVNFNSTYWWHSCPHFNNWRITTNWKCVSLWMIWFWRPGYDKLSCCLIMRLCDMKMESNKSWACQSRHYGIIAKYILTWDFDERLEESQKVFRWYRLMLMIVLKR